MKQNESQLDLTDFAEEQVNNSSQMTTTQSKGIRKMYLAAFTALLMAVSMGLAVGYSSPATFDMKTRQSSPIKPTEEDITWIGSILALGAMLGGIIAGPIADKIGRRVTMIVNAIPFTAGWLFICFSRHIILVIAGRLICGMSCGIISVTVPMYCVEVSTSEVRGLLGSLFQGLMVTGSLIGAILGSFVTWEYLALFGAAVTTFSAICFFPMPESPRWLIAKNDMKNAVDVMTYLQGNHESSTEECFKIKNECDNQNKGMLTWKECKDPTIYKPALICVALMFFQQFSGSNAVLFYSSSIFDATKDFVSPKKSTVILGTAQVVATLASNLVVDKVGRKILLTLSGILMALSLLILGINYYISISDTTFEDNYSWIPLVTLILFMIGFSIGYGPIPWLLAAEMVPVRARSTVGGLSTFANGIFAFIVTKTFSEMNDLFGAYGVFWTYSALLTIGIIFVLLIVPETKGKELESISQHFKQKSNKAYLHGSELS